MKVTLKTIDNAAALYEDMKALEAQYKKAKARWDEAEKELVGYVEAQAGVKPTSQVRLRGKHSLINIGKQRETHFITNPVEALRRLEAVEQGLGYGSISIPLSALRDNMAERDYADLLDVKYGKRNVTATDLSEDDGIVKVIAE